MRIVAALGGNALLRRGEPLTAAAQITSVKRAAAALAGVIAAGHQVTITHGNGPQVGLLALQSAAGPAAGLLPLDVLDAESEGWIGYTIAQELGNALPPGTEIATLLSRVRVDRDDPAFRSPSKPIGPVYDEATARRLAGERGWNIAPDGKFWRRVVASPRPLEVIETPVIRRLITAGVVVVCVGGGGIPVARNAGGALEGVEAVVDKDAASALLAAHVDADLLLLLTDVDAVYLDYGTPAARALHETTPAELRANVAAFQAGSMGPKVAAVCDFVETSGRTAAIGALDDIVAIIAGSAGTRINPPAACG